MATNRLIIGLAIIAIFSILLIQNWSPALSLVFLGMKTQPLPLAVWIVLTLTAGACTIWLIGTLNQLSNYLGSQKPSTYSRSTSKRPSVSADKREKVSFNTETTNRTSRAPKPPTQFMEDEYEDDWEMNYSDYDWDFEESSARQRVKDYPRGTRQEYRDYQPPSPPNRSNPSDSAYSYSSREPKNTGVGKTESIYDADYRVIIPPYQPEDQSPTVDDDDEDWGFFEDDDDFDDNGASQSSPKRDR
ncbi:MAG: LapA family protein [Richelia sp.]|nr:LapA family protein [Richelia sp.]